MVNEHFAVTFPGVCVAEELAGHATHDQTTIHVWETQMCNLICIESVVANRATFVGSCWHIASLALRALCERLNVSQKMGKFEWKFTATRPLPLA